MSNTYDKWDARVNYFILRAKQERIAQLKKWGPQSHSLPVWSAILSEEVGELSQQILRHTFNPKGKPMDMDALKAEAIQVSAVAMAIAQFAEDGSA